MEDDRELKRSDSLAKIMPIIFIGVVFIILLIIFNVIKNPFNTGSKEVVFDEKNVRLEINKSTQLSLKVNGGTVKYKSSNYMIADVNEATGYVKGINNGIATITAYMEDNKDIYDECIVEVYTPGDDIYINSIKLSDIDLKLYIGDSKKLTYTVSPSNTTEKKLIWSTTNKDVATIENDGTVKAISEGTAVIRLRTDSGVFASCTVTVSKKGESTTPSSPSTSTEPSNPTTPSTPTTTKPQIEKLIISSGSVTIEEGKTKTITYRIEPTNGEIRSIKWTSEDTSIATVTSDGTIKGIKEGNTTITLKINENITGSISVNVKKVTPTTPTETGKVSNGKIWGYTDNKVVNLTRAGTSFFTSLANKGIGSISGNIYTYSGYTYDISKSNLTYNGRTSLIRIYYPNGVDLSNVNTFALFGGTGEQNMKGFFATADKDTSLIKSSGIVILVSSPGSYHYQDAINATNFVKAITKQKSGKKNSVGGYSLGGPAAGSAMIRSNYDRLFILHSKVELSHAVKLKDKEIYVYAPKGDAKMGGSTRTTLTQLKNDGARKNLTVVTNDSSIINTFSNYFTIVNPGSEQGSGHGYVNFTNGNVFAFACSD